MPKIGELKRNCPTCGKRRGTSFGYYFDGGKDELGYCKNCKQFIIIIDDDDEITQALADGIMELLKNRKRKVD